MDNKDDSIKAEIIEKMDIKDDSIKAELKEKMDSRDDSIEAELVSYKENTNLEFDSMKDTLAALNNKTINIEDAIKEFDDKEAQCGYRHEMISTNSQTLTFDKVYVEV